VLAVLLAPLAGRAAGPGETVTGMLTIAGKQVPLPPGDWVVAVTAAQPAEPGQAPFGVVRSAILILPEGGRVRALMEVSTNEVSVRGGWASPCGNDPLPPAVRLRYRSEYDSSCAEAGETRLDPAGPPAWQAARAGIERAGLQLPPTLLTATALCADRQNFVEVRVHLGAVPGLDEAARRQVLLDWAVLYASLLEQGLSRRLDGLVPDWPGRAALLQESPVLERRLLRIEALRRAGTITAGEADAQERAAVQETPMSAPDPNPRASLYNRISSPMINFGTAYSVTWNAPLSLAIAASEHVARQLLASANETRWMAFALAVMPVPAPMPALPHLGTPVAEAGPSGLVGAARSGLSDLYP
jgi:hypothetical protein